ncbi:MAG: hypothetical protein AAFV25_17515, partial [Bacteroidota bacterium]
MKKCIALCCMLLVCCMGFAQKDVLRSSCSINAGGDQYICFDEPSFTLNGLIEGDVDNILWIDEPADQFEFSDVTSLTPVITPASGTTFTTGTFTFTITGDCDGEPVSNSTTVFIQGPVANAVISDASNTPVGEEVVTCNTITLNGTPPGPGDEAFWVLSDNNNITETYSADNSQATFTRGFYRGENCPNVWAYYTVTNQGCSTTDSVLIFFNGTDPDVRFTFGVGDGARICGRTARFGGSRYGCNSTTSFVFTSIPGTNQPTIDFPLGTDDAIDATFEDTGWYTLEYTVDADPPCVGGTASITFYICVTDIDQFSILQRFLFCEDFPDVFNLESQDVGPDCEVSDWQTTSGPPTTILPDASNPGIFQAFLDPDADFYRFEQTITCDTCLTGTDPVICRATHTVELYRGPDIALDSTILDYACGGTTNFRPWEHIESTGTLGTQSVQAVTIPFGSSINTTTVFNSSAPFDIRDDGTYRFKLWASYTENGVTCSDTTYLVVNVCEAEDPNAGETTTFTTCDTVQLVGSIPSEDCAQLWWQQVGGDMEVEFIGSNTINNPLIHVSIPGTYYLEYSYSRTEDCYLADTLEIVVTDCDTVPCFRVTSLRCVVDEKGDKCYAFELVYEDPGNCSWPLNMTSTTGEIIDFDVVQVIFPNLYVIQGTYKPDPGYKEFCFSLAPKGKCRICGEYSLSACVPLPQCPCVVSDEELLTFTDCMEGEIYCVRYLFDYCGPSGQTIDWVSNNDEYELSSAAEANGGDNIVNQGSNEWLLCFRHIGECDENNTANLDITGTIGKTECTLNQSVDVRCCGCREYEYELTIDTCVANEGQFFHSFTLTVFGVGNAGLPFSLSTNTANLPLYGWNVVDGDLVISGTIFGGQPGTDLCIDIDFADEAICDIEDACVRLTFCCDDVRVSQPQLECAVDGEGNLSYDFTFTVGNASGLAWPFTVFATCGDLTLNPIVQDPGTLNYIVSGTISNLTVEPGGLCCFAINFQNPTLCDTRFCFELPVCNCYENLEVTGPDCIDRESPQFCMTYTFDYFGPPTTGVSIIWYLLNGHDDDLMLSSFTNQTPGATGDEVVEGTNTWEFCWDYIGDCQGTIPMRVKAVMYTNLGI